MRPEPPATTQEQQAEAGSRRAHSRSVVGSGTGHASTENSARTKLLSCNAGPLFRVSFSTTKVVLDDEEGRVQQLAATCTWTTRRLPQWGRASTSRRMKGPQLYAVGLG